LTTRVGSPVYKVKPALKRNNVTEHKHENGTDNTKKGLPIGRYSYVGQRNASQVTDRVERNPQGKSWI